MIFEKSEVSQREAITLTGSNGNKLIFLSGTLVAGYLANNVGAGNNGWFAVISTETPVSYNTALINLISLAVSEDPETSFVTTEQAVATLAALDFD